MSDNLLTLTNVKKHFVIGYKDAFNRQPITVKAVDGASCSIKEERLWAWLENQTMGKAQWLTWWLACIRQLVGKFDSADRICLLMARNAH